MKSIAKKLHIILFAVLIACAACSGGGGSGTFPEQIINVSNCDSTSGSDSSGTYCSLDEAILAAANYANPVLLLAAGEYSISQEITRTITFRSSGYTASASSSTSKSTVVLNNCMTTGLIVPNSLTSAVTISGPSDNTAFRVSMTNSENTISVQGIRVVAMESQLAFNVTSGILSMSDSIVSGPMIINGDDSSAIFDDVTISAENYVRADPIPFNWDLQNMTELYSDPSICVEGKTFGAALAINGGASFTALNMEITNHDGIGLCVTEESTALLCSGSIHDIGVGTFNSLGRGAYVAEKSQLTLMETRIYDNVEAGVLVEDVDSKLVMSDGAKVDSIERGAIMSTAVGVAVQDEAEAEISDSYIESISGPGLYVVNSGQATTASTEIKGNSAAGVLVDKAALILTDSTVSDSIIDLQEGLGLGVYAIHDTPSSLTVTGSTIENNIYAGIYVAGDGGTISISDTQFLTNRRVEEYTNIFIMGHGFCAVHVCADLTLDGNYLDGNEGPQTMLDGSNATLTGTNTYVTDIANGITDFQQQDCDYACVTPLTLSDLYTAGLTSSNIVSICPAHDDIVALPAYSLYLQEVEAQNW